MQVERKAREELDKKIKKWEALGKSDDEIAEWPQDRERGSLARFFGAAGIKQRRGRKKAPAGFH